MKKQHQYGNQLTEIKEREGKHACPLLQLKYVSLSPTHSLEILGLLSLAHSLYGRFSTYKQFNTNSNNKISHVHSNSPANPTLKKFLNTIQQIGSKFKLSHGNLSLWSPMINQKLNQSCEVDLNAIGLAEAFDELHSQTFAGLRHFCSCLILYFRIIINFWGFLRLGFGRWIRSMDFDYCVKRHFGFSFIFICF